MWIKTDQNFLLESFSFLLPTKIEYGLGASRQIGMEVLALNASKVMIITDPGVEAAGIVTQIGELLSQDNIKFTVFNDVESNPRCETVERAASVASREEVDLIIAVGGGSSIDTAKGAVAVYSQGGSIYDYEGLDKIHGPVIPLIAIPTTAGTGSEVTCWAVITDMKRKIKMAVGSKKLAPTVALVDPQLTLTVPPAITASTGIDALTHAIEAYTVKCKNPISDSIALSAIEMIGSNIYQAYRCGNDLNARSGMMLGSLLAGIAFGTTDTAAVHCMAEALGAMFDVPHGIANSIFLPYVMGYNLPAVPKRIARIGEAMKTAGLTSDDSMETRGLKTISSIYDLCRQLGIPPLKDFGITINDLEQLAQKACENTGTPDNPREIGVEQFYELYKKALFLELPAESVI